jgi:pSer/pThr/pTyr-binding forkhead associated (FHA) protein
MLTTCLKPSEPQDQNDLGARVLKFSLIVGEGIYKGRAIPITRSPFIIGRDLDCHLRPTSPRISRHHCALRIRGGTARVEDLHSSNGTFLNDQPVHEEVEVHDGDRLQVGPLRFSVRLETGVPVNQPTPVPPAAREVATDDDEAIAAMLLGMQEDGDRSAGRGRSDDQVAPGLEPLVPRVESAPGGSADEAAATEREPAKAVMSGSTSAAARAILEKYLRRPRDLASTPSGISWRCPDPGQISEEEAP